MQTKKTLPPRLLFLTWRFSIRNNNQNASRDPLCVFWSRWSFPNPPCWSTQAVLENRWNTGGWNGGWEWPESPESWWGWFWVGWRWWCSVISIRKISKKKGRAYPRKDIIYIMIYIIGSPWGYSLNMNTAEYWLKWWLHMATIRYIYILNFSSGVLEKNRHQKLAEGLYSSPHLGGGWWNTSGQWGIFCEDFLRCLGILLSIPFIVAPDIFFDEWIPPLPKIIR